MLFFGDSRQENAIGATLAAGGYGPTLANRGVAGWLFPLSDGKLRPGRNANFGISGQGIARAALNPRGQSTSDTPTTGRWYRGSATAGSGSDNKGYVQAGQHAAGIVCFLMGTNGGAISDVETIIDGVLTEDPDKVIVLISELPKGIDDAGGVTGNDLGSGAGATSFVTFHNDLAKFDYASGDALSNPQVIVVDAWTPYFDDASGFPARNKQGLMIDGLHPNVPGGKILSQAVVDRLAALWPLGPLPYKGSIPTASGLVTLANAQPFINSNPTLVAGTNGTVLGTWGSAPTAATVPQACTITGTSLSGITCVSEKADGYWKITVSGTLSATTCTITLQQTISQAQWNALVSGGNAALTDKLRGMSRRRIAAGSARLLSVSDVMTIFTDTTAKNVTANSQGGSGTGASATFFNNGVYDAGDATYRRYQTELADLSEPGYVSDGPGAITGIGASGITFGVKLTFDGTSGNAVSAVIEMTEMGVFRSAD